MSAGFVHGKGRGRIFIALNKLYFSYLIRSRKWRAKFVIYLPFGVAAYRAQLAQLHTPLIFIDTFTEHTYFLPRESSKSVFPSKDDTGGREHKHLDKLSFSSRSTCPTFAQLRSRNTRKYTTFPLFVFLVCLFVFLNSPECHFGVYSH